MNNSKTETVELKAAQSAQAAEVLARAFFTDPMFTYVCPEPELRARILPAIQLPMVRYGLLYGKVFTTPGLEAAAIWLQPGETDMKYWRMFRSGMFSIPFRIPWKSFSRLVSIEKPAEEIRKKAISGRYWYLAVLGVDPAYQGKGIGGVLIEPALSEADRAGLPCYLETMNEANLAFYRKSGFASAGEAEVSSIGRRKDTVQIWGMVRQPRKG